MDYSNWVCTLWGWKSPDWEGVVAVTLYSHVHADGMSLALNETKGPLQETLPFHFVDTSHCHILDLPLVTLSHFRLFFAYLPSFISAYFLVGQQFPL